MSPQMQNAIWFVLALLALVVTVYMAKSGFLS